MADFHRPHPHRHSLFGDQRKAPPSADFRDVFGGPPKFSAAGAPSPPSFPPQADEYGDIFGGFSLRKGGGGGAASAIPFLDLPLLDENEVSLSVSGFDYSEIFGGMGCQSFSMDFDQGFSEQKRPEDHSIINGALVGRGRPYAATILTEESSRNCFSASDRDQFSSEGSAQHIQDGTQQVNVSCNKSNYGTKGDPQNETTCIAQLHATPGFTVVVDSLSSLSKMAYSTTTLNGGLSDPSSSAMEKDLAREARSHISFSSDAQKASKSNILGTEDIKLDSKSVGGKNSHAAESCSSHNSSGCLSSDLNANLKKLNVLSSASEIAPACQQLFYSGAHVPSTTDKSPGKFFLTVTDINLRTQPSVLPPPSRPPPKLGVKEMKENLGKACAASPPFFDVEVDAPSDAAASAAAMREAMEKAQAKLKSAKQSMERRRDNNQNRLKFTLNEDRKVVPRMEIKNADKAGKLMEDEAHEAFERTYNDPKFRDSSAHLRATTGDYVVSGFDEKFGHRGHKEFVEESLLNGYKKELQASTVTCALGEKTVERKVEKQFYELVKNGPNLEVVHDVSKGNNEQKLKAVIQILDQESSSTAAKLESLPVKTGNLWAFQGAHGADYNKLKISSELEKIAGNFKVCEEAQKCVNGNKLRLSKDDSEKIKAICSKGNEMAGEAKDTSVHESEKVWKTYNESEEKNKVKTACDFEERDKSRVIYGYEEEMVELNTAHEHAEEEDRQIADCVCNEGEKRQIATQKWVQEQKQLRATWECEEEEMRLKVACECEEEEKRLKMALECEEEEKKLKVVCEREEEEKRLKVTRKLEEEEERLKAAREHEEEEKRLNVDREREEEEKRLTVARESEEEEKRLKVAREREEEEKRLKVARECEEEEKRLKVAHEREEEEKRLKVAREREEEEKRMKLARELKEEEKRLKVARERVEEERRLKLAHELEEAEKRLKVAHELKEEEKRRKVARELEEEENRLRSARELEVEEKRLKASRECEEEEKRLKAACERVEEEKRVRECEEEEKRLRAACESENGEGRLKGAREREDEEKRRKAVLEDEEGERRLTKACEIEEENRLKAAYKHEEENLKVGCQSEERQMPQEVHAHEVKNKISEAILKAKEIENNWDKLTGGQNLQADKKLESDSQPDNSRHDPNKINKLQTYNKSEDKVESHQELNTDKERRANMIDKISMYAMNGNNSTAVEKVNNCEQTVEEMEIKKKVVDQLSNVILKDVDGTKVSEPPLASVLENKEKKLKKAQVKFELEKDEKEAKEAKVTRVFLGDEKIAEQDKMASCREETNNSFSTAREASTTVENGGRTGGAEADSVLNEKEKQLRAASHVRMNQNMNREDHVASQNYEKKQKEKEEQLRRVRDLELEQIKLLEKEREREREREKDRIAVERATREARDRAVAEVRERAERAAVERATAEARQRAFADARERAEKASLAEKASIEAARLRAERAAVERATAEARQRAAEKAMAALRDKPNGGMGQNASSSDDRKLHVTVGESAQRCKARLERHQRTAERAAKALAEKNLRDILTQREQAERNRLAETLDADIRRWSNGKEGNLRALLSTLQYILGPESGWQPVPLTEVITAAAVKKAYRKATLCVHPDKVQQRGASVQQKYICEKVFDLLKDAWNKFNSEER